MQNFLINSTQIQILSLPPFPNLNNLHFPHGIVKFDMLQKNGGLVDALVVAELGQHVASRGPASEDDDTARLGAEAQFQ